MVIDKIRSTLFRPMGIAPLVTLRIAFGALMFLSVLRFILKGWVHSMYVLPKMHFPYYGFEWVKALPPGGMYLVFALLLVCSLFIMSGFLFRIGAALFFLLFTYVEFIDKTNYLNHYYFVSLVSFILIFTPAAHAFSLDNILFKRGERKEIPAFFIFILRLQMFLVYFFAGVAKINPDWLLDAQPLKIWLGAFSHFQVIGTFMEDDWVAYLFSWFSCFYDLLIGFLLFNPRTVRVAYFFVVIFHLATALFFNIGMFPYIMMTITIVFFPAPFHDRIINALSRATWYRRNALAVTEFEVPKLLRYTFVLFFVAQALLPFRYLLYNGDLFWTEQGYRFSWRVMLMEKAGAAFFNVSDPVTGKQMEIDNREYLTYMQEKMMSTQPDMMVDFAHFLKKEFLKKGYVDPVVKVRSYVTLNGSGSLEFIDPNIDLAKQDNSFLKNKNWVKSY